MPAIATCLATLFIASPPALTGNPAGLLKWRVANAGNDNISVC